MTYSIQSGLRVQIVTVLMVVWHRTLVGKQNEPFFNMKFCSLFFCERLQAGLDLLQSRGVSADFGAGADRILTYLGLGSARQRKSKAAIGRNANLGSVSNVLADVDVGFCLG